MNTIGTPERGGWRHRWPHPMAKCLANEPIIFFRTFSRAGAGQGWRRNPEVVFRRRWRTRTPPPSRASRTKPD